MAQNSLRHSSTNLSPFPCVLGYQPFLVPWHQSQTEVPAVDDWFRRAEETWEAGRVHLQQAVRLQKENADRHRSEAPVFALGDRVWLSTRNQPLRLPCWKLGPRFVGPFKVLRRVNKVCYRLQLPPDYCINPSFHVSFLRPVNIGKQVSSARDCRYAESSFAGGAGDRTDTAVALMPLLLQSCHLIHQQHGRKMRVSYSRESCGVGV
ncbi:unnamed protein product [Oncorhynchus mykiss]|uniref:Tf2-1-like SH3-like domain-containing protein n=1 Tax=Oncorhynchus mykiss TaxID=8022 RepID=A0A060XS60_ONCMY|nr:unnamed protein product [Oncorhynchus mykiss]